MAAYLITGPNGTGKSTVGKVLEARSYTVIETDFTKGLAAWINTDTGKPEKTLPPHPFPQEWLDKHRWLWQRAVLEAIINERHDEDLFFVGGAYNQNEMYDLFTKWFSLYIDRDTATRRRLQARGEGRRWEPGSAELERSLAWHEKSKTISLQQGAVVVDATQTPDAIADEILKHVRG